MVAGIKALLQNPRWRTILFVLFVLLLYYTRTRPPDVINEIQILSDYAFLAMGKTGVAVIDLTDHKNPSEVTVYNTYGNAEGLKVVGDQMYIADGPDGLKVLSLQSLGRTGELTQTVSIRTPGDALDVDVSGDVAFVAARNAGLAVYQSSQKGRQLTQINVQELDGRAEHVVVAGNKAYVTNHKNRLFVFDISNPNNLNQEGAIDIPARINGLAVDQNTNKVYVATEERGLLILDTSNQAEIVIVNEVPQVKEAYDVTLHGTYAYIASGAKGYYVLDVSNVNAISILGHSAAPVDANQIAVLDEYVYVADDRNGLRSFESPILFNFRSQGISSSKGNFETVITQGNYAYVAAGEAGVRVINISDLSSPVSMLFDDGVDDYATSLDIRNDYLYVAYRTRGLKEYSIAETPDRPIPTDVEVGIPGEANDVVVQGNYAYVAGGSAGFHVVDLSIFTDPPVYSVETPGTAHGVFVAGEYAYVADGDRGFQIISIRNPSDPQVIQSINTPGDAVSIFVTRQTNSNGEIRTYAFVADGSSGLYITDITDINNPVEVTTFETRNFVNDVIVRNQTAFLAEREEGLLVLDISTINDPKQIGRQDTPGLASGIFLRNDDYVFVADWDRGLRIIDVLDPTAPGEVGFLDVPKVIEVMIARKPYGFMVDGRNGMWVLDLADPRSPVPISFYQTPGQAKNLTVLGSFAYIADGTSGLQVVDISNPQKPTFAGEFKEIQDARAVAVQSDFAYVISEGQKLYILNMTNLNQITQESVYQTNGNPVDIDVSRNFVYLAVGDQGMEIIYVGVKQDPITVPHDDFYLKDSRAIFVLREWDHVFIADGAYGLKVFDIQIPTSPELVYSYPIEGGIANGLTVDGNYLFVAVEQKGVLVFDIYDLNRIIEAGSYEPGQSQDANPNQPAFRTNSIAVVTELSNDSKRFITYVAMGADGLEILQADGSSRIQEHRMYESPGEASLFQVMRSMPAILIGSMTGHPEIVPAKVWARLGYILFGTVLFFVLSSLWLVLLAQFVLPVQTVKDGFKAVTRLRASLMGQHGPVVFIKEGIVVARPDELDRPGPGVARVDLNSAIVLEKRSLLQPQYRQLYNSFVKREKRRGRKVPRARVEGPGVVFVEPYESIHGVADLRPQFRIRPQVRAYTRDGIEIENPIWILFTLGQPPSILDVTYEGERKAENLRVIQLDSTDIPARESIRNLDEQSAHYYQQYQRTRRFFQKVKDLAESEIVSEEWAPSSQESSYTAEYIVKVERVAIDWEIADVPEVREFLSEVRSQVEWVDVGNSQEIEQFIFTIHVLADRLLGDAMTNFYENIFQGKKQRGTIVKSLSDELDADDRDEIHRHVQKQTTVRYFVNAKALALQINYESQAKDGAQAYVSKMSRLARRWGIYHRQEIQQFIDGISALLLEINLFDLEEVRWFVCHVSMLADELRLPEMVDYYEYLYQELVSRYQSELQSLISTRGLSRFARQSMAALCDQKVEADGFRMFALNAFELWGEIRPEFEKNISKLESDPENLVEIELMQIALGRFDRITQNLMRTDYPYAEAYSSAAGIYNCIGNLQLAAARISLLHERKFPDALKLYSIRKNVRDIIQQIEELNNLSAPTVARYVDLTEIYDFVQLTQVCVSDFRQLNTADPDGARELHLCVVKIKQQALALEQVSNSSFRRPVRKLMKWAEALSDKDPAYVYYFSRQVEDLWKRIEVADQIAVRRYARKVKSQTSSIQRNIREFEVQARSLNGSGEIKHYQKVLNDIQGIIDECPFSPELIRSASGDPQIRVGPFQFVRRRVLAAVYSKALDIDQEGEYMPWTNLPVHAAAQTFRDLVAKEQYDYLYEPKDTHKFNIPKLKSNFSRRMRNQGVLSFRFVDHIDGEPLTPGSAWLDEELVRYDDQELKTPKVLRARGVKVIAAGFPDLFPVSPKVPEQLLDTWRAPWESKAVDIRGQHQLQAVRVINRARAQAQLDMAHTFARILQSSRSEEALAMRVFQALEATAVDPETRQFLPRDTMYLLRSFKQWFLPGGDDQQKSMGDLGYIEDRIGYHTPLGDPGQRGGLDPEPDSSRQQSEDFDDNLDQDES